MIARLFTCEILGCAAILFALGCGNGANPTAENAEIPALSC